MALESVLAESRRQRSELAQIKKLLTEIISMIGANTVRPGDLALKMACREAVRGNRKPLDALAKRIQP